MNPEWNRGREAECLEVLPGDNVPNLLITLCEKIIAGSGVRVKEWNKDAIVVTEGLLKRLFDALLVDNGEFSLYETSLGEDMSSIEHIPKGASRASDREDVHIPDRSLRSLQTVLAAIGRKWNVQVYINDEKFRINGGLFRRAYRDSFLTK